VSEIDRSEGVPQQANSYDEWSRLREVVVGRADFYDSHDVDSSFRLFSI
jgi:glycine amidinotransferase